MSLQKITSPEALAGDNAIIEIKQEDGTWCRLPGVNTVTLDPGQRSTSSVTTMDGTRTRTGELSNPGITFNLSSWLPVIQPYDQLYDAWQNQKRIITRWTYPSHDYIPMPGSAVSNPPQAAIAQNTGVVTLTRTDDEDLILIGSEIPEGASLYMGTGPNVKDYLIVDKGVIGNNGQVSVNGLKVVDATTKKFPTSAVSAATFGFRTPAVRRGPIICEVVQTDGENASAEQTGVTSEVILQGLGKLQKARVVSVV